MARMSKDLDVVGIGSMVVDFVYQAPRIPGPGEKVLVSPPTRCPGGVTLNHLAWASVLGAKAGVFGHLGDDEGGRLLHAAARTVGLTAHVRTDARATAVAHVLVTPAGERTITMVPGATTETTPDMVRAHHADFIARARMVSTEVSQLPLATALEVLHVARDAGATTVVDLDVLPSDAVATLGTPRELDGVVAAADILKPTRQAAEQLADGATTLDVARSLRAANGHRAVLITDGARGCAISTADADIEVAPPMVTVVDATGAGDAFLGGVLFGLSRGLAWGEVASIGTACGAACCEATGAFPDPLRSRGRVEELHGSALPD